MVQRDYILPKLPVALPTTNVPDFINTKAIGEHFEGVLNNLTEDAFVQDAVWRDSFIMTGTLRTFYSSQSIFCAWQDTAKTRRPTTFVLDGPPRARKTWMEIGFTFKAEGTPATTGYAYISVVSGPDGQWKIWVLRTILEQIENQPSVDKLAPFVQAIQSQHPESPITNGTNGENHAKGATFTGNGASWISNYTPETNGHQNGIAAPANGHQDSIVNGNSNHHNGESAISNGITDVDTDFFDCVVVGGGQAGLGTGGRLKALGVSYVILEKNSEVGDSWATRYDSTRLHTVRNFSHLPFDRTFDSSYQEFLTKDDLARGYKKWVKKFDINIWLSTTLISGSYNTDKSVWDLVILRNGTEQHVRSSYIVFAVGAGCNFPISPKYENKDVYRGIALHSAEFKNAKAWKDKHGVVVGSGNTAHDIAEDMLAAGLKSVTMVQRNKTCVVPIEHYRETHDAIYNEQIPIEVADRLFFTGPQVLGRLMGNQMLHGKARKEPERFDALERAGFKLDREGELAWYLFERFGGHYMDVGTSAKIASGLIKMQSASLPVRYLENGLECANGDQIPADVIVFATGFVGNLRPVVSSMFGAEVADQLEDYWGMDDEGELKGAFKHSGHPAFWYVGGAIGQARYMSRWIALQIKLKLLGTPIPIYQNTPPRKSSAAFKTMKI